jgi:hypothetical protein
LTYDFNTARTVLASHQLDARSEHDPKQTYSNVNISAATEAARDAVTPLESCIGVTVLMSKATKCNSFKPRTRASPSAA